jgi:PAS domain S-box-containing protein
MKERQFSVLIAGAAPEDRAILREALSRDSAARYAVIEVESGLRALDLCRARKPDCLILDHDLPDLSGLDVLKKLADEEGTPACAVVLLISAGDAQLAVEARKSGAHDCIEKGRASGSELRRAVSQAVEKAEHLRRVAAHEHELIEKNRAPEADLTALRREAPGRGQGEGAWQVARAGAGSQRAVASRPESAIHNQTEEQLQLLKTAIEQSNEPVIIMSAQLDPPGPQIVFVSPAFTKMTGYAAEEVIGKTPHILEGSETDRSVIHRLREDCLAGEVFHGKTINYRKDRSEFHLEWTAGPVRNERGEVTHFAAALRDVTEGRRIEEELRRSEEEFRSLFDLSAVGMTQVSPEGRYLRVNRKLCQMLGYSEQELLQLTLHDVTHPDDREVSGVKLSSSSADGAEEYSVEKRYVRKDGAIIWALINWTVVRDAEGRPLRSVANIQDITQRKQVEESLRVSEERLDLAQKAGNIGTFDWDLRANKAVWTEQLKALFGLSPDDPGDTYEHWLERVIPEDRPACEAGIREILERRLPKWRTEYRIMRADTGEVRWIDSKGRVFYDEQGEPLRLVGTATDITERKRAEAEREELLILEQSAREAAEALTRAKDEFLALVSHELRSPLNAILGYAALLRHGELDDQKVRHAADVIERSGKAQAQLIEDLLDTARIISGKLRLDLGPVDLASVIEQAVQTIRPAADAKGISIETDLPSEIDQITGDPARLQQVVWNLLSNAVKFTPQGGRVEARLERVDPHICIVVRDTGKGINPDFLPYVFERFRQADVSSARRYGGLGLGLALVKYLVELHGGTAEAASAGEGRGATFKVTLPVRAVATPLGGAGGAPDKVKRSEELAGVRALVVDDEEDARELLKSALTQYGAGVVAAGSAAEAYELITTAPTGERPDVMVTDIGMPGEDGYSLIRRVREWELARDAYIPAVALTAYGRPEDRMRALRSGFQMHIAKPVDPAELAIVITSLMRRPNSDEKT